MLVSSIQHIFGFVRDTIHMKVYRTLEDPKTHKEYVYCEVYTYKGVVEKIPEKGKDIDIKV